ncbi:MAG: hypothetical protein HKM03_03845 [Steroidobacteraceae bacterium]|nr:hypothetical protein [Steroidobacteraceae bacterium]
MTIRRMFLFLPLVALTAGCHTLQQSCHGIADYQAAQEAAPIRVPSGMDSPDVKNVLKIPPPTVAPPPPKGKDGCIDGPPQYRRRRQVSGGG